MTTAHTRRVRRAVGLTVVFGFLILGLVSGAPQVGSAASAPITRPTEEKKEYPHPTVDERKGLGLIGAAECKVCHNLDDPTKEELYQQTLGYEFVRLRENKVWSVHDLHSTAYKNLLTNRTVKGKGVVNKTAQKMEDNLRRYKGENYTVASDSGCLACHSSLNRPTQIKTPDKWIAKDFTTVDGVGCEMCHGHGSLYKTRHRDSRIDEENAPKGAVRVVDWREADPKIKAEWGLVNLRDPVTATTQCASCHIGNLADGRFVIHEWYAAGHPPLPPLDLIAYTREQPRHWGLPSELPYFAGLLAKDPKKAEAVFSIRANESHVARRFAESALASLQSAALLTGQLAAEAKDDGLDYAAFDCASCHHNLKYPSDRQDRGYAGKPGRPLFRPAAFALARLIVGHAAEMEGGAALKDSLAELSTIEKNLAIAFTNKTYGDGPKVAAASEVLKKWSSGAIQKLAAVRYTPEETKKLLAKVIEATQQSIADPEVAQLYVWAYETLVLDLIPPSKEDGKLIPPRSVTELRSKLSGFVVTRLRPDPIFSYEVPGNMPGENLLPVDARIGARMEIFNSFRDAPFRKAFEGIKPLEK